MFRYKNIANRSLEIFVEKPFTQEEVNRAFSYMDALAEDSSTEISFNVPADLKENLEAMIGNNHSNIIYDYRIIAQVE